MLAILINCMLYLFDKSIYKIIFFAQKKTGSLEPVFKS